MGAPGQGGRMCGGVSHGQGGRAVGHRRGMSRARDGDAWRRVGGSRSGERMRGGRGKLPLGQGMALGMDQSDPGRRKANGKGTTDPARGRRGEGAGRARGRGPPPSPTLPSPSEQQRGGREEREPAPAPARGPARGCGGERGAGRPAAAAGDSRSSWRPPCRRSARLARPAGPSAPAARGPPSSRGREKGEEAPG